MLWREVGEGGISSELLMTVNELCIAHSNNNRFEVCYNIRSILIRSPKEIPFKSVRA